jgi:urease accessory protein UreF
MSAWHWLKDELRQRLGEEQAAALWAEYRARAALDLEAAATRDHQRRARMGNKRSKTWLADRGIQVAQEEA